MKKILAFDLDGTLAPSKSAIPDSIAEILGKLLDYFQICIISGGHFERFEEQVLANLEVGPSQLERIHIMPTCGTRYYVFNIAKGHWQKVYSEDLNSKQKAEITKALRQGLSKLDYKEKQIWGEQIEDRGSQVTFSALGQQAPFDAKQSWDPTDQKKALLRDYVASLIPQFEVRTGGTTSLDITKKGIDKAYGMRKLIEILGISKEDILFFGDKLKEGGNDYPVKAMGIDSLEVSHWQDTVLALNAIWHVVVA